MPRYIVTKNTATVYSVEDASDMNEAKAQVENGGGTCITSRESIEVNEAATRRSLSVPTATMPRRSSGVQVPNRPA